MAIGSICKPEYNYFILTFSEINLIHKLYNIVIITFRLSITYLFERDTLYRVYIIPTANIYRR